MSQGGSPVLEACGVSVRFGAVKALDDVSFRAMPRTIHSIIGPNGAGKSTLLNVLSGLYKPTAGTVRLGDAMLTGMRPDKVAAAGIGRAFQNLGPAGSETVLEALLLGCHLKSSTSILANGLRLRRASRQSRDQRSWAVEVAGLVGLTALLDAPVASLSYGNQKRVDIGRALCMEPQVLVLDEPVAGMTRGEAGVIGELIHHIRDTFGHTVLLVEHDMQLVMGLSDQVTVLNFGSRISDGPPDQVQADPAVIEAYLGTPIGGGQ